MHGDWNPLSSGVVQSSSSDRQVGQSCMVTGTPCHQVWFRALPLTGRSVMHGDWNPVSSGVVQSSSSGMEVSHAW